MTRHFISLAAWTIFLALSLAPASSASADEAALTDSSAAPRESLDVYDMDEVLVTASRLASNRALFFSNVSIATKRYLAELSSSTAAEALTTDSGTGILRYGSYGSLQTMTFRGGSSSEIVYLLDGVPIADPQVASVDLNWLPMSGTERVEAMKGGASARYGSGAVGGAVNLVSMDAMPEIPSSEVSAWTGSFGSRAVGVTLRRSLVGRVGVLAAYDHLKSDGWVSNSACRGEKFYGKVIHLAGAARVEAVGFKHTSDVESPGAFPGRQSDNRDFLRLSLSSAGDDGFRLSYYRSTSDQTYVSFGGVFGDARYDHQGGIDGVEIEAYATSGETVSSSFGAGLERKTLESSSVGDRSASDIFAFFQREISQNPLRLAGSLRVEKNSGFRMEASPQIAAWLLLGRGLSLFSKIDRSFSYPSFNDLYWRGPNEAGDPGLRTEHSAGVEAGARLERGPMEASATAYYRAVDDMILWRTGEPCQLVKSTNAGATLKGLELACALTSRKGLGASVSYWFGEAVDEAGKPIEYKPANVLAWRAALERFLTRHVSCGLVMAGRTVSRITTGDQYDYTNWTCLHGTSLPAYSSAVLYAYLGIDRGRAFVRVNNLFDDEIYSTWGMPALPGRSYELGIRMELRD
jgi:outer membrane cobalamin receptor